MKRKVGFVESAMINRRIVFFICILLILIGIFAVDGLRKNEFPDFVVRQGVVVVVYLGASVREVEERAVKPLEDYIFTYREVQKAKTVSTSRDGLAFISVQLNDELNNKDEFWSKFKHGVNEFKTSLPSGVAAVIVKDDFGDASSLLLSLESPNKTYKELDEYMDDIIDAIRPLKSVGRMNKFGMQNEQISVYMDAEKMSHYGISAASVMNILGGQGLMSITGTLKEKDIERPLYIKSDISTLESVRETVIFAAPDGSTVRLKDVAEVMREIPEPISFITQNGNKCLVLSIEMKKGYNVVKMGKEISMALEKIEEDLPSEVTLTKITDQSKVVDDSVKNFLHELVIAIVAVLLVVLLLLPLSVSLVAAVTIPISIFISLALMYLFNFELNTVTLAALIVTLGMIVDNSIVIIDDYQERVFEGENRWKASIHSAMHFMKSIFSATLAISVTFFPFLLTMKAMMLDFLTLFPWSLTIVLGVSLLVALLIVPFLQFAFIKPKGEKGAKKHKSIFQMVSDAVYPKVLNLCFEHPVATVLLTVIAMVLGVYMLVTTPTRLLPIAQRNQFSVEFYMPSGSSLKRTIMQVFFCKIMYV